jgi:hypothetical protein
MPLFPPACLWKSLEPCLPWFRVSEMCLVSAAESGSHSRERERSIGIWSFVSVNVHCLWSILHLLVVVLVCGIESCVFARLVVWRPSTVRRILRWYWCHSSVITRWYFGGILRLGLSRLLAFLKVCVAKSDGAICWCVRTDSSRLFLKKLCLKLCRRFLLRGNVVRVRDRGRRRERHCLVILG